MRTPWIVGVSGASGTPYAAAVLRALLHAGEARPRVERYDVRHALGRSDGLESHPRALVEDEAVAVLPDELEAHRALA